MSEQQIQEIEIDIQSAKKFVARGEALARLNDNPDFKLVILDGYFKEECMRNVALKAAYAMRKDEDQKIILKAIDSIGELNNYLSLIEQQAQEMSDAIAESNLEIQDLYSVEA